MGLDTKTGSIMAVKQVQLGNMENTTQKEVKKALRILL